MVTSSTWADMPISLSEGLEDLNWPGAVSMPSIPTEGIESELPK